MQRFPDWTPAAFCAVLSGITLISGFAIQTSSFLSVLIPFLCFLPICFFFVGSVTSTLRKDNALLRDELDELRGTIVSDGPVA